MFKLLYVLGGAVLGAIAVEHVPAIKTVLHGTTSKVKSLVAKTGSHIGLDLGHLDNWE